MPIYRINTPPPDATSVTIENELAHHLVRVLRVKLGHALRLTDGRGSWWQSRVVALSKQRVQCELLEQGFEEQPAQRTIVAIAIIPKDRWRFAIEKATELGADIIQPMITERTEVPRDFAKKREHWEAVITAAAQQSDRSWIPELAEPLPFAELCSQTTARALICVEPYADMPTPATAAADDRQDRIIFIGPAGGWSDDEIALAQQHCELMRLGRFTLRTETAVCAALARLPEPQL